MQGRSKSRGQAGALFPVYQDLPTSYHSKDDVVYAASEVLRTLPKGSGIICVHGVTRHVLVPLSKIAKL